MGTDMATQAIDSKNAALIAARAADAKKAVDVVVQEVGPLIGVTDYFVMATGANPRQVDAIIDQVEDDLREKAAMKPLNREIAKDSSWSLLDYGPIVVHVFLSDAREYYRLEQLWPEAHMVDLAAEDGFENLEYTDRMAMVLNAAVSSESVSAKATGSVGDTDQVAE